MADAARERIDSSTALGVAVLVSALAALAPGCLERRDDVHPAPPETRCATCHGDPDRAGDELDRSAPPRDLLGMSYPAYPGVGAHQAHFASETHAAVACSECHVVPDAIETPGHVDDARPAEVRFGSIASTGGRAPVYDATTRRCADTWCHRDAGAVWTEPRSSKEACGTCHGLPPAEPHPQATRCELCHGDVVEADRSFRNPALHVDGKIQVHGGSCTGCHGSGGDPAPPTDTAGDTDAGSIGVDAHRAHLDADGWSRALACDECHVVPESTSSHPDALPAEVVIGGVARMGGFYPVWDRESVSCVGTWCHGPGQPRNASPSWTTGSVSCTSCHGSPPPAPHPQLTDCSRCHGEVIGAFGIEVPSRHVDGIVDVSFDKGCTACHGSANPAPPADLGGSSDTSSQGVGAHQTHVLGTPRSRPVPCGECHVVPQDVFDEGHFDTPAPAEVVFGGAALAFGATPDYALGSCKDTACHGARFPSGHASGGSNTMPVWTIVDGSQASCGSCHGLPPPAPHPKVEFNPVCSACHENVAPDNTTFVYPELHVDGEVTFAVP